MPKAPSRPGFPCPPGPPVGWAFGPGGNEYSGVKGGLRPGLCHRFVGRVKVHDPIAYQAGRGLTARPTTPAGSKGYKQRGTIADQGGHETHPHPVPGIALSGPENPGTGGRQWKGRISPRFPRREWWQRLWLPGCWLRPFWRNSAAIPAGDKKAWAVYLEDPMATPKRMRRL